MFSNAEYVYEVYKERSFSKAARNLYISQPALSVTIRRIEAKIGAPIFDRSVTPVALTECGKKYIEIVKQMLDLENNFMNYMNDLQDLKTGSLSIGGSNLFTSCVLPPLISEFKSRFPSVIVNVVEANTPRLEQYLVDGDLDLVLDNYSFDPSTHASHLLRRENLLLAIPSSYPINDEIREYRVSVEDIRSGAFLNNSVPAIPFERVMDLPFIMLRSGNDTREKALRLYQRSGGRPKTVLVLDQLMTSYNVCCTGLGMTLVTDTLVISTIENPAVIFYKIDPICSERELCFFHKRGKYVTRAMDEFIRIACGDAAAASAVSADL